MAKKTANLCIAASLFLAASAVADECDFDSDGFFESATVQEVQACIASGEKVNERAENGITPLHLAVRSSAKPAVMKALLAAGADVNSTDDDGNTALHVAAGADVNSADDDCNTALHVAAGADSSAGDNANSA